MTWVKASIEDIHATQSSSCDFSWKSAQEKPQFTQRRKWYLALNYYISYRIWKRKWI